MSKKQITVPVFIPHLGCPHCCRFCNQWRVSAARKLPDAASIDETIDLYLKNLSPAVERVELAFFGGSFTGIDRTIQISYLESVRNSKYAERINGIRVSTRPDYIDEEGAELLKRYDVETVELGVQSFSDEVLEKSGRGHTGEDVDMAIGILKSKGFRTGIQLMPGLPGDTFDSVMFSGIRTLELAPDDVRIYPTVVLRDTELEDLYRSGRYNPLSLDDAVDISARLYGLFISEGINVIRMGIHPMEMSDVSIVAGPYHTAFGFLVKSRYRLMNMLSEIDGIEHETTCENLSIKIPSLCSEEYIGMRKNNMDYIKKHFALKNLTYQINDISRPVYFFIDE